MFRPAFLGFCILFSLIEFGLPSAVKLANYTSAPLAQSTDEPSLRAVIEQYYAAYAREDLDAMMKLWGGKSPYLPARRKALEKFFADNDRIETSEPTTRKAKIEGEGATLRVAIEIKAIDAKTGRPASGVGKLNRSFHFVREEGKWGVWREESTEAEIAAALVAAKPEAERKALMSAEKEFLTDRVVRLLQQQGSDLVNAAKFDQAHARFLLTQALADHIDLKNVRASVQIDFGNIHFNQGEYDRALEFYEQAVRLGELWSEKRVSLFALSNIGLIYYVLGDCNLALGHMRRGLKIAESLSDDRGIAAILASMTQVLILQGNYSEAALTSQKSLRLAEGTANKRIIAAAFQNMGDLYFRQGNYDQALEYYQQLVTSADEMGNKIAVAQAHGLLGAAYAMDEQYDQALTHFQKSLTATEQDKAVTASTLFEFALMLFRRGDYSLALEYCQRGLSLSEEIGFKPNVADILSLIGRIKYASDDYNGALEAANRAAILARDVHMPREFVLASTTAGKAYQALNNREQSHKAFMDAITEAEALRLNVAGGEQEQQRFFEKVTAPYYGMIGLLIAQNRAFEALSYAERAKARVLLDVLQSGRSGINKAMTEKEQDQERKLRIEMVSLNAQLRRETQSEKTDPARVNEMKPRLQKARLSYEAFQTQLYAAHPELKVQRGDARPLRAEEAATLLTNSSTALLEYAVTDDATYLFVLTRATNKTVADLKLYSIPVKRKELATLVESFRQKLASHNLLIREPAMRIYDLLLKPAQEQLKGKSRVVIVPDDVLWELPFQASVTGAGRYFIEESAISYAPSLTVLREMVSARKKRSQPADETASLLALGNPTPGKETVARAKFVRGDEKLEPLPEAEREVKTLGQLYGATRSRVFIGADAREDRAKADAGRFKVLHFATHGVLNNASPMYSHLVLSQGEGGEDGLLEAWELMGMDLKADVAVLSACDTARGRVGAGEGMIGLSWALFVAGCPTTVVSQWKVDSASTSQLMLEFHRNYRASGSKAEGLRKAMLKLLRSNQHRHPFYWAPFVIIGDGN